VGNTEPAEYLAERLREAIATEPDVHELGLTVQIIESSVVVTGAVSTPSQREAIGRVVQRLAPDYDLVDEVDVPPMSPPDGVEQLN
jgi:osmotically-inducible protein OsmY